MSEVLRRRCAEFLERPVPKEINYTSGSLVERFIGRYASGDHDYDNEQIYLLSVCYSISLESAETFQTPAAKKFFVECANIVEAILEEWYAANDR